AEVAGGAGLAARDVLGGGEVRAERRGRGGEVDVERTVLDEPGPDVDLLDGARPCRARGEGESDAVGAHVDAHAAGGERGEDGLAPREVAEAVAGEVGDERARAHAWAP